MVDHNDRLKAMISISTLPYTVKVDTQLGQERKDGSLRGPLHGIPFIIKVFLLIKMIDGCRNWPQDALNTTDEFEVHSTAGGWALVDLHPSKSARIVESALNSGHILVGKANLSVRET